MTMPLIIVMQKIGYRLTAALTSILRLADKGGISDGIYFKVPSGFYTLLNSSGHAET